MSWPQTLPQTFIIDGYQETWPDNLIRQPMDVGPPKTRQRQTAKEYPIQCSQMMTTTQLGYLETFFKITKSYGALSFTMPHPRTTSTVTAKFKQPPTFAPWGGGHWVVNYVFEISP